MKLIYLLGCFLCLGQLLPAQTATVRGKIIDGESGEPLIGATVSANQDGALIKGAATDLDGAYSLELVPGDYQLLLSFLAYATDSLDVTAVAGEVLFNETVLYEEGTTLATAVVTARARQSSAVAITLLKQKSNNAIDGISSDFIQRTGDRNLATAVPRITGVSVESGKYISVRGLGDRYSKTMLNGGEIPALDAERNTTQLDIFPSTLVDNIIVYKNFSPDLPGDFTGGLVDIRTKTHPTEFQLSFSASVSYNPTAHLRDDFLSYAGGDTDWLGIDDGTRDIPAFVQNGEQNGFPLVYPDDPSRNRTVFGLLDRVGLDSVEAATAQRQQQSFADFYTIRQKRSGLNQNYQFSVGNQTNLFGKPLGFLVGLSYRRAFQYNENYRLARFETVLGEPEPRRERDVTGVVTEEEALWGGILGLSYKLSPRNKFSFTYMHNQSGINATRQQRGTEEVNLPTTDLRVDETQSFQERSLDLFQLRAEHVLGKVKLDWQGSYTFSTDDQPDFRIVQYLERGTPELRPRLDENGQPIFDEDGNFIIDTLPMTFDYQSSINDFPTRYYRELDEDNFDFRLNVDIPWQVGDEREAIIGLGGAYTRKDRSFREERYAMEIGNIKAPPIDFLSNGDIDLALAPENVDYVRNEFSGTFNSLLAYDKRSQGTNAYQADQSVFGAYAMIEYPLSAALRAVAGVRLESTEINIATDSLGNITQGGQRQPPIRGDLSEQDLLPAVNLIYRVSEKMNFRGGYSRTLARPSFRELAPYRSFAFFGDF
ncbi:MAG: TonB-dependent receptor, partial [Bacteroidota bacterium]